MNKSLQPKSAEVKSVRVALYERVSSQEQAQYGVSLAEQRERLELLAKLENWQIYDHYVDEGVSGGIADRPHLQRLLADARAGRIDLVACCKLDRFFRNTRLLLNCIHELESHGVSFVAQAEGIDTRKPGMGKILLALLGAVAEWERERIGQRVQDFRAHLAKKGQWSSGRTPFGYRFDGETKQLTVEAVEADVVRFIFTVYTTERVGLVRLAERLNKEKKATPRMGRRQHATWTQSAVRHILVHPAYKGGPGDGWKFATPAVVSPDMWNEAQERLRFNRRFAPARNTRAWLRGKLRCGVCGHTLRVGYSHGTRPVYECPGRLKRLHLDGSPRCTLPRFHLDDLEGRVRDRMGELLRSPENFRQYLLETLKGLETERQRLEVRLKPVRADLAAIERQMKILDAKLEAGRLDADVYKASIAGLRARERETQCRLKAADPLLLEQMGFLKREREYYEGLVQNAERIVGSLSVEGVGAGAVLKFAESDNCITWEWVAQTFTEKVVGIMYPERIDLQVNLGKCVITPAYRSDRCPRSR